MDSNADDHAAVPAQTLHDPIETDPSLGHGALERRHLPLPEQEPERLAESSIEAGFDCRHADSILQPYGVDRVFDPG